jgi:hypothetical protein
MPMEAPLDGLPLIVGMHIASLMWSCVKVLIGFKWFRVVPSRSFLLIRHWPSAFQDRRKIAWAAEKLSSSLETFCSVECVSWSQVKNMYIIKLICMKFSLASYYPCLIPTRSLFLTYRSLLFVLRWWILNRTSNPLPPCQLSATAIATYSQVPPCSNNHIRLVWSLFLKSLMRTFPLTQQILKFRVPKQ